MNRAKSTRLPCGPEFQTLEDRRMLAAFGTPWQDARNLAVSFPADGVQVGRYENGLHEDLDAIASRQDWQELVLRAYQTWSIHADINVGLRNDYDSDFGTPGLATGDPRFGEFRMGAIPQQGLLANSIPFQAIAGTYSGDLILNSNEEFRFHDWAGGQAPDPESLAEGERDLFSLLLHESGNTLGIDDNQLEWSVMFEQYTVPKGMLEQEDIASIQALYGARTDPYETVDNGQLQWSTLVQTPVGFDPEQQVLRSRGSLLNGQDVDHYKIIPPAGRDEVSVRVRAYGVSLLQSKLEVIDAAGNVLQQASAASVFENDSTLTISGIDGQNELYVRVSALDSEDVYAVGDYVLEIDYRDASLRAQDPSPAAYDSGEESVFASYDPADALPDNDDQLGQAVSMDNNTEAGQFEAVSSVHSHSDVDYLALTAPGSIQGRLVVHVAGVGADAPSLRVQVVDGDGVPVGTGGRLRSDGTFSVEVARPVAHENYYVRISVDPSSAVGVGNYVAVADFEAPADQMNFLAKGATESGSDDFIRWTAHKTKLFRFDLSAFSRHANQAIKLTIYDAHTREVKMVAVTRSGVTRNVLGWLQQGEYILRFTAVGVEGADPARAYYYLRADGLSDDQEGDDPDSEGDWEYNPYDYYGVDPGASEYDYYSTNYMGYDYYSNY